MTEVAAGSRFVLPASAERIAATTARLTERHFDVFMTDNAAEARVKVLALIPLGAEVLTGQSATIRALGLFEEIDESGRYESVRKQIKSLDRATQGREYRKLGAAPDVTVGSVHAITDNGQVVTASFGGSQLGPYVYAAGKVIWVVGSQKLVKDLDEAFERIEQHSLPLESERLQNVYGRTSAINKLLIVNGDQAGRTSIIIVREPLGF